MSQIKTQTFHRLMVETARVWVIDAMLRTGQLPEKETRFAYAEGPNGFDWGGNAPGPDEPERKAIRGKRVRVTFEIEELGETMSQEPTEDQVEAIAAKKRFIHALKAELRKLRARIEELEKGETKCED